MVVYYALGGGLGHLTRAAAVLAALGARERGVVLTASPFARDPRVTAGLPVLPVPRRFGHDRAGFRRWLAAKLAELEPEELIVDSFPGGILGELCGLSLPPARYVARRLRWGAYARRLHGPLPRFELAHVLEPLELRHRWVVESISRRVQATEVPPAHGAGSGPPLVDEPHMLVVHSGPVDEVAALAGYALEVQPTRRLRLVVVSPTRPNALPTGARWLHVHPVAPHLAGAELVVSAAGWGVMRDMATIRVPHRVMPFPRPLDDQFWRAATMSEWSTGSSAPRQCAPTGSPSRPRAAV